ncbi:TetR/AcrR family transcriptional regulator [Pseudomonas sp. EA_105y_Pfl2_R69]|uniref:TetR/AcrR family transcriptional regulator n=1 Tax=Pseudomonas sp. EA_105y_Pfl2_R69 TaxID=3088683 RepID=UPI0030D711EF
MVFNQTSQETKPRRKPRQNRSVMTFEAILDAAAILFAQDGFESTSTTKVARLAGVSVGSLYEYFPNKDSLIANLIQRHCEQMLARFTRNFAQARGASLERVIEAFIDSTHEAYAENYPLQRVLLAHIGRVSKPHHFKRVSQAIIGMLEHTLLASQDEIRRPNLRNALFIVECAVESLHHRALQFEAQLFSGDLKQELLVMAVAYLKTPGAE